MKFTDVFIKRPVLATALSLIVLMIGLAAFYQLPVQQYPSVDSTVITVTTSYPGANASTMLNYITRPLSKAVGASSGVDYMTSTTTAGSSVITAYISLGFDPNAAMTNVTSSVNIVTGTLPQGALAPVILKESADNFPILFINFSSSDMNAKQISAYLSTVVIPKLDGVPGVALLRLWGGKTYAMRIWLNPKKMAAYNVTPQEVLDALKNNNVQAAPGQLEGQYQLININAETTMHTAKQFDNLVVKSLGDKIIRIKDIGEAELGEKNYNIGATYNGKSGVFLTVLPTPDANPLTVVDGIYALLPTIEKALPGDLKASIAYDGTQFVRISIEEVIKTIVEAAIIVMLVIFLFLGSLRAVLIPLVTIPLSLIGVCFLMQLMGFSINLLTLLAFVIAIGLVVDDAILVLENIYRYLEAGEKPMDAALKGARQIAVPVIVMTLTLAAVYAPIGFLGGVTGSLFIQFAFTLAACVIVSGFIALTFSPMMCSKLVNKELLEGKFVSKINHGFNWLKEKYKVLLDNALNYRYVTGFCALVLLIACAWMYTLIPSELAPQEDQGFIGAVSTAPPTANLAYMKHYGEQVGAIFDKVSEKQDQYIVYGFPASTSFMGGLVLKPWDERIKTQMQLVYPLQQQMNQVTGAKVFIFQRPTLPGTPFGPPVNFVLTSTQNYSSIYNAMIKLQDTARKSGLFSFITGNLTFNNPQLNVQINRSKAASMGINMSSIATALDTLLGGNYLNYFSLKGYNFYVIPQVARDFRGNVNAIKDIYINTSQGKAVPLSSVMSFKMAVEPSELEQFQQQNSATLLGMPAPGVTLGQALTYLQQLAETTLPKGISFNYGGASRQYIQEGSTIMYAFIFAVIFIFLLLAGKFESFRDPLIILFAVPLSVFGALLPLFFGLGTINIYTQIGLITLVGLITKHGILMVEFANELRREQGLVKREAIVTAASIRLRPILMTTAAMVVGVIPLIIATGPGAVSRNDIGVVISFGLGIGTLFTLFVVPAIYMLIGHKDKTQ